MAGSYNTDKVTLTITNYIASAQTVSFDFTVSISQPYQQSLNPISYAGFIFNGITIEHQDTESLLSGSISFSDLNLTPGTYNITFGMGIVGGDIVDLQNETIDIQNFVIITSPNSTPTDITLSNSSIAENAGANAVVGTLSTSDPDTNNSFTYTLVTGEGATGNASFDISGDLLIARDSLDYETQSTYSVRIRSTDQGGLWTEKAFTITVTDVNETPRLQFGNISNYNLNAANIQQDVYVDVIFFGSVPPISAFQYAVNITPIDGSVTITDVTKGSNYLYPASQDLSFVFNSGTTYYMSDFDLGNAIQPIDGVSTLGRLKLSFNHPSSSKYTLHFSDIIFYDNQDEEITTVSGSYTLDINFNKSTSLNLVASDSSITTTESSTITAHVTAGAIDVSSGTLDVSFNGGIIYSGLVLNSSGQASFDVSNNTAGTYPVQVTYSGTTGYNGSSNTLNIEVSEPVPPNSAPSFVTTSPISVSEGINSIDLSANDTDGNALIWSLVSGDGDSENHLFTIGQSTGTLTLLGATATFDHETKSTYNVRVNIYDGIVDVSSAFVINVTDVNETPTDITLSNSSIAENAGANAVVGTLSTTDPDTNNTFTYTLVAGEGATGNASFDISGDLLIARDSLDYETQSTYSVRIRSTDQGGLWTEKAFTITVTNVNDFTLTDLSGNVFSLPYATQSYNLNDSLDLTGANLRGADLTGAIMNGVNLTNAILGGLEMNNGQTSIPSAILTNASLIGAIIGGLDLILGTDAQDTSVILTGANLRNADFTGLDPYNSPEIVIGDFIAFSTVLSMEGANFSNCNLPDILLINVDLSGANFTNTILDGANFTNSNLTNADFTNATLNYVIFSNVTITNTDFTGSSLAIGSGPFSSYQGVILPEGLAIDPDGYVVASTPSNSAPIDISLNNLTIAENNAVNAVIGTFSTTDPDTADTTFTYSLVSGDGATGNAAFNILGNQLRASVVFDYETQTTYSIRVRSTDPSNNTFDKIFTITVTDVDDGPGTVYQPFGITGGKVSSQVVSLPTGSSFYFQDTYVPNLPPQQSTLYKNPSGPLQNVDLPGPQVSIVNIGANGRNIVFSSVPGEVHNALQIDSSYSMIFKVFDNSGNILADLSKNTISMDIYLDVSKSSIVLTANGVAAGTGTKLNSGHIPTINPTKFKYRVRLTRGDGLLQITPQDSNASSGSDPHITTLFGKKYDFHPSTRKNYTLFKTKEINITSHFTGLKHGIFYDRVNIDLPNKEKVEVDFNKRKIKGKSKLIEMEENDMDIGVRYNNHTQDKSVGKVFKPKSMTKISYKGKTPMDLYIDYQTRYVHFRFPEHLPQVDEMSGLIVEPVTRLD
jgi:VCBS repeat-containing protein